MKLCFILSSFTVCVLPIIRLSPGTISRQSAEVFLPVLTFLIFYYPPIILNSGYELNQKNFFNNMFPILVYAIPGTIAP